MKKVYSAVPICFHLEFLHQLLEQSNQSVITSQSKTFVIQYFISSE